MGNEYSKVSLFQNNFNLNNAILPMFDFLKMIP